MTPTLHHILTSINIFLQSLYKLFLPTKPIFHLSLPKLPTMAPLLHDILTSISIFLQSLYELFLPTKPIFHHEITPISIMLSETTLKKRAGPNKRLITVFGIQNPFTCICPGVHGEFIKNVANLLQKSNNDKSRKVLAEKALRVGEIYIERGGEEGDGEGVSVSVRGLVEVVVFRTVLKIFFPHVARGFEEDGRMSDEDVKIISEKMDKLWWDSKSRWKVFWANWVGGWSGIVRDREVLLERLELRFPWYRTYRPERNPLNILVPAHQGLWGVALRLFLEVRFRASLNDREEWRELFRGFLEAPTGNWHRKNEQGIDVQMLVAETLRLYPPTKRMYIQQDNGRLDAIDIQGLHRDKEVWGEDSRVWRPVRWVERGLDVVGTRAYMPFGRKEGGGDGVGKCPSRLRGGPKLIAVLVGVLLEVVDGEWELDGEIGEVLGEGPLGSGRDVFKGLRLRRKDGGPFEVEE